MILGLDMRFLGGKWQKKNNGNSNDNRMSRFAMRSVERDGGAVSGLLTTRELCSVSHEMSVFGY
jgi:hypothetical protein